MQTEKHYYSWESSQPFEAKITETRPAGEGRAALLLDKTVFYPEGGGQGADRGSINGLQVLDVQEKNGEILHIVKIDEGAPPQPGTATLILDEKRRADFTVQHTAQHLLSGIIMRRLGLPTVSFHLGDETSTLDIDPAGGAGGKPFALSAVEIEEIEDIAAGEIEACRPVSVHLCPPADINSFPLRKPPPESGEALRIVEIQGNDFSACCGTHCKSTGQLGMIRILGAEKHKSHLRISYIAGRRVLRDSRLLRENALAVSRALTVPLFEIGKGTQAFLEKARLAETRLAALSGTVADFKAAAIFENKAAGKGAGAAPLIEVFESETMEEVLLIAKALQKRLTGDGNASGILVFASKKELKFAALCCGTEGDVRDFVKDAFEKASGKGGGGKAFFQGSFATEADLAAFLAGL
ncbi:MAG: alanyl-tRNA editing protein [Spirochaetes bacterium]|nr:alanyl-tRNA editing protein [Spirochaetota bacterium]